jgi:hypothetical protein
MTELLLRAAALIEILLRMTALTKIFLIGVKVVIQYFVHETQNGLFYLGKSPKKKQTLRNFIVFTQESQDRGKHF